MTIAPQSTPVFRLENVRQQLGDFMLNIHDLHIQSGEVLGLLGPTGAGKSTLLRLLAGQTNPTQGSLFFEGTAYSSSHISLATRRRITLVYQHPQLLSGSVAYNVGYGLRLRGETDFAEQVKLILQQLGLLKLIDQSAQTLSGGQAQLVALARALIIKPDVLLLDEPTVHLDPASVATVESVIQAAQQQSNMTVVWATHNLFQAQRVFTRTALLLNGELVEEAPTEDFFNTPRDARTADFVQGRMIY